MSDNSFEKKFKDSNGTTKVTFQGNDAPLGGDFVNNNYIIANHKSGTKKRTKSINMPGMLEDNIGIGSSGFAGIITLASIIAVAGAVIAFFALKY